MASPLTSGTGQVTLLGLVHFMGEDAAFNCSENKVPQSSSELKRLKVDFISQNLQPLNEVPCNMSYV